MKASEMSLEQAMACDIASSMVHGKGLLGGDVSAYVAWEAVQIARRIINMTAGADNDKVKKD